MKLLIFIVIIFGISSFAQSPSPSPELVTDINLQARYLRCIFSKEPKKCKDDALAHFCLLPQNSEYKDCK